MFSWTIVPCTYANDNRPRIHDVPHTCTFDDGARPTLTERRDTTLRAFPLEGGARWASRGKWCGGRLAASRHDPLWSFQVARFSPVNPAINRRKPERGEACGLRSRPTAHEVFAGHARERSILASPPRHRIASRCVTCAHGAIFDRSRASGVAAASGGGGT